MTTITLRSVKGSPLTNNEVDSNFSNLNSAKYESGASPDFVDTLTDKLSLDTAAAATAGVGEFVWDAANATATLGLLNDVFLQLGQEQHYYIKASSAISDGQVVMFTGTLGASGMLTGAPATGLTASTASYVMGIATQSIALNDWGYVTAFGLVRGIDTSAFSDGAILYLDPTTPGGKTTTIPTAPNPKVQIGAVVYAAGSGSIFVRPSIGGTFGMFEGDVNVSSATTGDLLVRNGSGVWANAAQSTINAGTVTNGVYTTGSYANPSWITSLAEAKVLPTQTGNTGKWLQTNGTNTSWQTMTAPNNGTLTMNVSGTGLSGSASFTADQAGASTFTVTSNATSANTASTVVARDASGNFSAGTITATLSGNASTATNADQLDGQHGAYYQPASTAITTSNIGSQSVNYATSAGSTTNFMSTSHAGSYWLVNNWDGTYWSVTSNHGAGVRVSRADSAGSASYAAYLSGAPAYTNGSDGWWRSSGQAGWYNSDYGVGIYATEAGNVRTYNGANFISAGNLSATSDERLKENWRPVATDFVECLATVKSGVYDRTDNEFAKTQVGVSAQSLQKLLPEAILEDPNGILSVTYGNAALVAAIELAKEVVLLRAELAELKEKVNGN